MAEDHIRSRGQTQGYKHGTGNQMPATPGPYIGIVKNNIDPTRAARLQVYIEQFAGPNKEDEANWRTVNYLPPFFGSTEHSGAKQGTGSYIGNKHSYGMWFTPPDIGTKVLCFFVAGDPNQGYYVGCIPEDSLNHMVPAIGSATTYLAGEEAKPFVSGASQVPVTEINNEDPTINDDPQFYKREKPVHKYLAANLFSQGLIKDNVRGPITSTAQRESPSNVFGVSTPGKPIYAKVKGDDVQEIKEKLKSGDLKSEDIKVVGREGGHSIVLDDGDIEGKDQLVRIRTAQGHQILMSDDGECLHIIHANGLSWVELGKEGTVDVFSTNSINMRTQGSINFHADKDINMYAGRNINTRSLNSTTIEAQNEMLVTGLNYASVYSKQLVAVRSDNTTAIDAAKYGSYTGGDKIDVKAGIVNLNNGGGINVTPNRLIKKNKVSDAVYNNGWQAEYSKLETIATRVPHHEPWPYHNLGVENSVTQGTPPQKALNPAVAVVSNQVASKAPTNPITTTDYAKQAQATKSIGSLDQDQATGMLAQKAKDVGQAANIVSPDKGIGSYGISAKQLEETGYLKPGTAAKFLKDPSALVTDGFGNQTTQLEAVLKNTNVWTGKGGTNNLTEFLKNPSTQSTAMEDIYSSSLSQLKSRGLVTGGESPEQLSGLLQAGSTYGVDAVQEWTKGGGNTIINAGIEQTARNAQYATNLVENKIANLSKSYGNPGGFANTVDVSAVLNSVNKITGDVRIRKPKFF